MFLKGFVCGWIGMAAIIMFLLWGMTPSAAGTEDGYQPRDVAAYEYREC